MKFPARQLRLIAWITLAAILAMLWSGMAHARINPAQLAWGEICSAERAAVQTGKSDPDQDRHDAHVQHCAFCAKQDIAHVLPSRFDYPLPAWVRVPMVRIGDVRVHAAIAPGLIPHPRGPPRRPHLSL